MIDPRELRRHYTRFLKAERVLMTGHSHQAWPDAARRGVLQAYDDACSHADDKWELAFAAADAVRAAVANRIGVSPDEIALGASTHELVSRFLSALDLRARPHIVTTSGEFHSMRRQLARLSEVGIEVTWVATDPVETLSERLGAAVRDDTAALMVSSVLFETATRVPHLERATEVAREVGADVLIDAYHAFGVVPFTAPDDVYVTAGGYKYVQWGEGCCWLRVPTESALRPLYTGWFADFAGLSQPPSESLRFGPRPADRFAGSTYDPTSHYRARAVIEHFEQQELTVARLHALSLRQTQRLLDGLSALTIRTPLDDAMRGGFVTIDVDDASAISARLRERGVFTDARGRNLRLGPAPYVTDDEIDRTIAEVLSIVR